MLYGYERNFTVAPHTYTMLQSIAPLNVLEDPTSNAQVIPWH